MVLLLLLLQFFVDGDYCYSGPTTTLDSNLGPVSLVGNTLSIYDPTDCPGEYGVQDKTNLQADLSVDSTYTIQYQVTSCGSQFNVSSAVWIDLNQNTIYEADELIFNISGYGSQTASFTIPSSALPGTTRMRVQVQESSYLPLDPCKNFPYGGTKDFGIIVQPRTYCPSGPTSTKDSNLGAVSLAGDTSSIDDTTDCPGVLGVQDLTKLEADLSVGNTYTIQYQVTTCGVKYNVFSAVWIDFNQNDIYEQQELMFNTSGYGTQIASFKIPSSALLGTTRMRVQVQENTIYPLDPCKDFTYGGTKDFGIIVGKASTYCSSGPTTTQHASLGPVYLKGNSESIEDTTACPGFTGVQDLTSEEADLWSGANYTVNFYIIPCDSEIPLSASIWIDWNVNDVYDPDEMIYNKAGLIPGTYFVGFYIPVTATLGKTRMRVQLQETSSLPLDPCKSFSYGGTKDFSVVLKKGTPPGGYCKSGPGTSLDTNLGPVTLKGNTLTISDTTNCPGKIGVQDLTNLQADLSLNTSYTIQYQVTSCGMEFSVFSAVWIDLNQNAIYDADELMFNISGYGAKIGSFVIPQTALPGLTRMRVQAQEPDDYPLNPCNDWFLYGGTKDFGIIVVPPSGPSSLPQDLSTTTIKKAQA